MMKDTQNNMFLSIIYELYDKVRFSPVTKPEVKSNNIKFPFFFKEKEEDILDTMGINIFLRSLNTSPSFETLWEFCEFVRIAEKIFFYKNVPENNIFVEMNLTDSSEARKILLNTENSKIKFILTHNILSRKSHRRTRYSRRYNRYNTRSCRNRSSQASRVSHPSHMNCRVTGRYSQTSTDH